MTKYMSLTDDQLVEMYKEGTGEAFDALLSRYQDRLFSFILFSIHDREEANDVFQDTFVKAIISLRRGSYTSTGRFYAWLTSIAHNVIIDRFRSKTAESGLNQQEISDIYYETSHDLGTSEDRERESAESLNSICQLMNDLPEKQKEVVTLHIFEGKTFQNIANEKGIPLNTALARMRYAVLSMKKMAKSRNLYPILP